MSLKNEKGDCVEGPKIAKDFNDAEATVNDVFNNEIKAAMFGIGDCKAPSPDELFKTGKLLKEINSTLIALIPKVFYGAKGILLKGKLKMLGKLYTTDLVNTEATSSGSSFININNDGDFASNTPIVEKICKIERQICEGKLRLLDNDGNPLVPKGIVESDSKVESYPDNDDYDPYDDDINMETNEIPCRKVLDDKKKKKKKKAESKAAANALDADIQIMNVASKRCDGKRGSSRKRRKVLLETPVHPDSDHASSLVPLNYAKPLKALANEEHVSTNTSVGRMDVLRNQTDEHVTPRQVTNVDELVLGEEKGQEDINPTFVNEGHDDNKDGLSGLRTQPSPVHYLDQHLEFVKKPARDTIMPDAEASNELSYICKTHGHRRDWHALTLGLQNEAECLPAVA
nr:hypothetical protein [Tanacetum cinerariifolium]